MAFRILKFVAAAVIAVSFLITLCWPPDHLNVWAQLPAPNPLLAPVAPPSAPAQLPAPVPNEGVPSLVAVPSPPAASPTVAARSFACSCFGPGNGTAWMGSIVSTSFFGAKQAAQGACIAFNERSPSQPAIPSISSAQSSLPLLPGNALPADVAGAEGLPLPNTVYSAQRALSACERCGCS